MPQKTLLLLSVGSPPATLMRELQDPLAAQMGVIAVLGKAPLPSPTYAFNKDRKQYHCNAIMRRLTPMMEPPQTLVMGVTDVDLFVPDSPFVLGEADRESKTAVVSTHRLAQGAESNSNLFRHRVQVEVVHQAGHLVGLSYCEDPRCVMFFAQSPQDCDRKQVSLCNTCRNELQKLNR